MITYRATLDVPEEVVHTIAGWLRAWRAQNDVRPWQRAASCYVQAVMFCRWVKDGTKPHLLARDANLSQATAYRYVHQALEVVAEHAPDLAAAIAKAKDADEPFLLLDGTLVPTNRVAQTNPETGYDLWYSGKHHKHGANTQVLADHTGYPLYVSPAEPGSTHDITAARTHVLPALYPIAAAGTPVLADKGYTGAGAGILVPVKGRPDTLDPDTRCRNQLLTSLRGVGERANALLKGYKVLDKVTFSPEHITAIVAAVLVFVHMTYPSAHSW